MGCPQICGGLLIVLGIGAVIVGVVIPGFIQTAIETGVKDMQKNLNYACVEGDDGWKAFEAKDPDFYTFTEEDPVPAYEDYFLYDILNPIELLQGKEKAKIAEVGPFVFQGWTVGLRMSLVEEGNHPGKSVKYEWAGAHILLDEDVTLKTNLGKEGGAKKEFEFESRAPANINRFLKINQFSLGYLGALGLAGNEFALLLVANGCTAAQAGNIADTLPTCTDAQLAAGDASCSCCWPDDFVRIYDQLGAANAGTICDALVTGVDDVIVEMVKAGIAQQAGLDPVANQDVVDAALASAVAGSSFDDEISFCRYTLIQEQGMAGARDLVIEQAEAGFPGGAEAVAKEGFKDTILDQGFKGFSAYILGLGMDGLTANVAAGTDAAYGGGTWAAMSEADQNAAVAATLAGASGANSADEDVQNDWLTLQVAYGLGLEGFTAGVAAGTDSTYGDGTWAAMSEADQNAAVAATLAGASGANSADEDVQNDFLTLLVAGELGKQGFTAGVAAATDATYGDGTWAAMSEADQNAAVATTLAGASGANSADADVQNAWLVAQVVDVAVTDPSYMMQVASTVAVAEGAPNADSYLISLITDSFDTSVLTYDHVLNAMQGASGKDRETYLIEDVAAAGLGLTGDDANLQGVLAFTANQETPPLTVPQFLQAQVALGLGGSATDDVDTIIKNFAATQGVNFCECSDAGASPSTGCCLTKGALPGPEGQEISGQYDLTGAFCEDDGVTFTPVNGYNTATTAAAFAGLGDAVPVQRKCSSFLSKDSPALGLVSFLAKIDGGIPVANYGDADDMIEGGVFTTTMLGQTSFYSPLIQSHTANDIFYGYGSALIGTVLPMLTLGGQELAVRRAGMAESASYTDLYQQVCPAVDHCSVDTSNWQMEFAAGVAEAVGAPWGDLTPEQQQGAVTAAISDQLAFWGLGDDLVALGGIIASKNPNNYQCSGFAPGRGEVAANQLKVADHDCAPSSWTYSTKFFCGATKKGIVQQVMDGMQDLGMIADAAAFAVFAGDTFEDQYDFSVGQSYTQILSAFGNDAAVVRSYFGLATEATNEDVVWAYAESEPCQCADATIDPEASDFEGCCLAGGKAAGTSLLGFGCLSEIPGFYTVLESTFDLEESLDNHDQGQADRGEHLPSTKLMCPDSPEHISDLSKHEGKSSFLMYSDGTNTYDSPVHGGDGKLWTPQGLTGTDTLSDDDSNPGSDATLYVSQILRSLNIKHLRNEEIHPDYENIKVAIYGPDPKVLWTTYENPVGPNVNPLVGTGKEWEGVQPLWSPVYNLTAGMQVAAPNNLPLYLHHVNYLHGKHTGDDAQNLLTAHDMYHCVEYDLYSGATFPIGEDGKTDTSNSNCVQIDATWVADNIDKLDVVLKVEPATGLTLSGAKRLGASLKPVKDCNPAVDATCLLALSGSGLLGSCHQAVAGGFLAQLQNDTGMPVVSALTAHLAYESKEYAPGFPCSEANVVTPNFVGGKLFPVYWASQWSDLVEAPNKAKTLNDLVPAVMALKSMIGLAAFAGGAVLIVIGAVCIKACGGSAEVKAAG